MKLNSNVKYFKELEMHFAKFKYLKDKLKMTEFNDIKRVECNNRLSIAREKLYNYFINTHIFGGGKNTKEKQIINRKEHPQIRDEIEKIISLSIELYADYLFRKSLE